MDSQKRPGLSRSASRSRRSQVNLANLRISPLSTTSLNETSKDNTSSSFESAQNVSFRRSHSSYIQGKSAPTSPGILSRSSSRKNIRSGLSRRPSLYDEVDEDGHVTPGIGGYDYGGLGPGQDGGARVAVGSGRIPKAKSEAALLVERSKSASKSGQPRKVRLYQGGGSRTGGTNTPRAKSKVMSIDDDWFMRTGAATNALLQENKGQSWASSTTLKAYQESTDEEDDEGYEELAAQSAADRETPFSDGTLSPVSMRGASKWGSRYGSRTASRRTSRRGSISLTTGSRTPLATAGEHTMDYFDDSTPNLSLEPDFVDDENESQDEASLDLLAETHSFGMGGIIDRIMNFNLFRVEEREEMSADDEELESVAGETEEQAIERREKEKKRKREEKEKLVERSGMTGTEEDGRARGDEGEGEGAAAGWVSDAAWLLGVASKAIF